MRDLKSYFINPFFSVKFGFLIKLLFAKETLKRLQQNSPGETFADLVNRLAAAVSPFETEVRNMDVNQQKSSTATVEEVMGLYISTGQELNDFVSYKYRTSAAKQLLFFPNKMDDVYKSGREDMGKIIDRWKTEIAANAADFSMTDLQDKVNGLEAAWESATSLQSGAKSAKKNASNKANILYDDVAKVLFALLRKFVETHPDNPDIIDHYFDTSIVNSRTNKDNDGKGDLILHLSDTEGNNLGGLELVVTDNKKFIKTITSNAEGDASLKNLAIGTYKVQVLKEGKVAVEKNITVFDDNDPENEILVG